MAFLTLFSFSTLARGIQFLVPLLVTFIFKPSTGVDAYFYWSTQINLAATLIASIWPTTLMAVIVRAKATYHADQVRDFSSYLIRKYCMLATIACLTVAVLAFQGLLGGQGYDTGQVFFWQIFISSLCISFSLALAEIGTANRQFAIVYKAILVNALVQIIFIALFKDENLLLTAFTAGGISQLLATLILLPHSARLFAGKLNKLSKVNIKELTPGVSTVSFLYLGSLLSALTSHLSFRILDDQLGAVSAFAVASMLALAPQQLLIQQLSTVAAVSMAECFQQRERNLSDPAFLRVVNNWRSRLFKSATLAGLAVAYSAFFAVIIIDKYFSHSQIQADHWKMIAYMCIFLALPMAVNGLNTWVARLNVSVEKIREGVYFQIGSNTLLVIMLLAAYKLQSPYSSCLAMAIFSVLLVPAIELFSSYILKKQQD